MVNFFESKIFGREKEIESIFNTIIDSKNSITCIVGESGIGKTALLEEFYRRLKERNTDLLIGFFGKNQTLLGESLSPIYPFISILENLLEYAKTIEKTNDKIKDVMRRIEKALIEFAKEKGSDMAGAILHDIAIKFGFEKTLEVAEPLIEKIKGSKSAVTLALYYTHEHSNEPVISYTGVIESLLEQFENRPILLIFDQFETVKKSSIDFLINFIRLMHSQTLHIIVSFKIEEQKWSDMIARQLFEYAKSHLHELGAQQLELSGLTEESIDEWIKKVRNVTLDSEQLTKIKQHSAGFPILLNEWISKTKNFDYNEINKDKLCVFIYKRREGLSEEDDIILNKMAILAQLPITIKILIQKSDQFKEFAEFIGIEIDRYPRFIDRLVDIGLFSRTTNGYPWFKHELVQSCIEKRLKESQYHHIYREYHSNAARFYEKLLLEGKSK